MIKIIIIKKDDNIRLDKYLKLQFTSLTQSFIQKNIRKKNILINRLKTQSKYIVKKDDELKILNFHPDIYKNKILFKRNIKITKDILEIFNKSITYQNNNFLILNKWGTIATQGGSKINISIDDIIKTISPEYKLVHRLDKDTSGLLIIAKNRNYAKLFGNLFKLKLIEKTYLAICEGKPKTLESEIDLDIKNKLGEIQKTKTYYKLLNHNKGLSLILFKPSTGKTHQLRIVSKNLTCPIVGDLKYNNQSAFRNENLKLNAHILKFTINDNNYNLKSDLPKDFLSFMKIKNLKYKKSI